MDSHTGKEITGHTSSGDYSGLVFPYFYPGAETPHEYRLRRDSPDLEHRSDGTTKERKKYLSPPGRVNLLYFVPGTPEESLSDVNIAIALTEGEKKVLALWRLARHECRQPRFLPIGLSGVWNWRGSVGKTLGPSGERTNVKGPIADLDLVQWKGRVVYIVFDSNVATNSSVKAARRGLSNELTRRGAQVLHVDIPTETGVNGVDDFAALSGPERALELFESATPFKGENQSTQAQVLIDQVKGIELFHTPASECFASFHVGDHTETWPIRSKSFRLHLVRKFFRSEGKPPSTQARQDAIQLLQAQALFEGGEQEVFVRVAGSGDAIYLDLADKQWRVVEIDGAGWRIANNPPVKFRRPTGMLPLPVPVSGGSLEELRPLINPEDDDELFVLDVSWLIGCLKPTGPYPLDVQLGEHGSAKSTRQRLKRSLIDPIKAPLRSAPRSVRDLMIAAKNAWIISFDNLSFLPNWFSDALCCLATGSGFSTRELYSDDAEQIFESCRSITLNAIENMLHKTDLVDRTIIQHIPPIPATKRKTEKDLIAEFENIHPRVLGGLLDAVSMALRNYSNVKLERLPRMADFAKWVVAAEPALPWPEGTFMKVYNQNRSDAIKTTLEADALATAIRELMRNQDNWEGTPTELHEQLDELVDDRTKKSKGWPGSAAWLSRKLNGPATFLRSIGIDIQIPNRGKNRLIRICVQNTDVTDVTDVNTRNDLENQQLALLPRDDGKTTASTPNDNLPSSRQANPGKDFVDSDAIDSKKRPHSGTSGKSKVPVERF